MYPGFRAALATGGLIVSVGGCVVHADDDYPDVERVGMAASMVVFQSGPVRPVSPVPRPGITKPTIGPADCRKTTYLVATFLCRWTNGLPETCRRMAESAVTASCKGARAGLASSPLPAAPFRLPTPAPAIAPKPTKPAQPVPPRPPAPRPASRK